MPVRQLLETLQLERLEDNLFRGVSHDMGGKSVFGGQVLGQSLMAAGQTVTGRIAHSMHGYFLRPGDVDAPIIYEVDRIRDGTSFTTRRVVAIQHGRPIFNMAASFQIEEDGVEHQDAMPEAPPPEDLLSEHDLRKMIAEAIPERLRAKFMAARPVEMRPINPVNPLDPDKRPPRQMLWFRAAGKLPDDFALHQAALAFSSDFWFVGTAMLPHGLTFMQRNMQIASLDHALWIHRRFRADEWMLYVMESPSAGNARGFNRGSIFSRDGKLLASVAQEGLIRIRPLTEVA
jgi:acyl-CoA thioesterase-2